MEKLADHPEIQRIERTGYPIPVLEPEAVSTCCGCGYAIMEGEDMLDWGSVHLHDDFDCVREYVYRDAIQTVAK